MHGRYALDARVEYHHDGRRGYVDGM